MCAPEYSKDSKEVRYMDPIKLDLSQMSRIDRYLLSSTLCDAITKYFENPVNRQRFEEWQKKRANSPNFEPFTPNSPQK